MRVALGKCQEFTKCTGMFNDSEYLPPRTVAAQTIYAPVASAATEIYLADYTLAEKCLSVGLNDLADRLVARHTGKPVIAALKLEVSVADAAAEQADQGRALGSAGTGDLTNFDASIFEKD